MYTRLLLRSRNLSLMKRFYWSHQKYAASSTHWGIPGSLSTLSANCGNGSKQIQAINITAQSYSVWGDLSREIDGRQYE